jgi:phenylacetate-coenzyme A ligase PaaK-like adenylate-forming protein
MWDQAACASPQNLFVEAGVDVEPLMDEVARSLERFPFARGRLSDDEHVEILKEKARARYNKIMRGGDYRDGSDYLLHLDPDPGLRPSPLNRSLVIKRYDSSENLVSQLVQYSRHLQSCSMLAMEAEEEALASSLGSAGVMRFARLGHVMEAPIGAPHDGRMTLMELTRIVPEELDSTLEGFANDAIANVPFYRELRGGRLVRQITEMPLIKGSDLDTGSEEKLSRFIHGKNPGGYVFSSGGTSGAPKYMVYTHDEFAIVAELLATAFRAQGVRPGSVVANLFVAGNLWSSFMAVDQAMARIGARVLPIGGMADKDQTITWLERFRPDFVVGLPTQIIELVRRAEATGRKVKIPAILYGGEHLTLSARKFLTSTAGTAQFGSAGYASVDAGPIGYQCLHCSGGEHHLFASHVHLEVIDGEGVVTSRVKRTMPVIRLRTGDLIEWLPDAGGKSGPRSCPCGSADRRFRLLGRADSQFNVWGCRLFINDIEKAIADCDLGSVLFQIHLKQDQSAKEEVILQVELPPATGLDEVKLRDLVYHHSRDLAATHPRPWLDRRMQIVRVPEGGIQRVERTGKIKVLVDHR